MAIYKDQVEEGIRYLEAALACFEELTHSTDGDHGMEFMTIHMVNHIGGDIAVANILKSRAKNIEDIKKEMNDTN